MKKLLLLLSALLCLVSCSLNRRIENLRTEIPGAIIEISEEHIPEELSYNELIRDTLTVKDDQGNDVTVMKASKDENGEMVARDVLSAVRVTARFRNVAERQGKVDLYFQIIVPPSLLNSRWQLRFQPLLHIKQKTLPLDRVYLTGAEYRAAQLRGYQQYERFISRIITDSAVFRRRELEIFLERNLPNLFALKTDTTYVSDEIFASLYGVTERNAIDHYTNKWKIWLNDKKESEIQDRYDRYVKVPISTDRMRLDTVLTSPDRGFIYEYSQTIDVEAKMKNVGISLEGSIFLSDEQIFTLPHTDTLTYYISSLSSLVEEKKLFVKYGPDSLVVPDLQYEEGLEKIREKDYKAAVTLLQKYADYNTAVAYTALGYNASALNILLSLDKSPKINYLLAIVYSRREEDRAAVQCYQDACAEDHSLVFRANLDPEIYTLIRKYNIKNQ